MQNETRLQTIRRAVDQINHSKGRGQIKSLRMFLNGQGEADRQGQYFTDKIKFRVEERAAGYRVFALGTSRVVRPEKTNH